MNLAWSSWWKDSGFLGEAGSGPEQEVWGPSQSQAAGIDFHRAAQGT